MEAAGKYGRARYFPGFVALDGRLYAVGGGGDDASTALNTAEVYDPQTDGWQPLAKMTTIHAGLGLAAVGGKIYAIGGEIYAIGGEDGHLELDSVEAYDPQLGSWALVASTSVQRVDHASVVLDGKIYTIGGDGGNNVVLDSVEVYNPQADSW